MYNISLRLGLLCLVIVSFVTNLFPLPPSTHTLSVVTQSERISPTQPAPRLLTVSVPQLETVSPPQPGPSPAARPQLHLSTLEGIQHRGTITILMHHDPTSYFLYQGKEKGFEYELASAFAKELGVTLKVLIPPPGTPLTQWLREGKGDVAAGLVITAISSPEALHWSVPYLDTSLQRIASRDPLPTGTFQSMSLTAKRSHITQSNFVGLGPTLEGALQNPTQLGHSLHDDPLGMNSPTEAQKRAQTAIVTAPLAKLAQTFYPGKFSTLETLPTPAQLVWAVRPEQADLLDAINQYLQRAKRSGLRKVLFENYFVYTDHLHNISQVPEFTLTSKRLSRYDPLIAYHAEKAGFDWRFVAALVFEESRFVPTRISNRRAVGLMQVTRIAAQEVGVKNFTTLQGNVEAGVKYLQLIAQKFPYNQENDRLAFALAGYLIGPRRVADAQRLAQTRGYDPHSWAESVEVVFPLLEDPTYYRQTRYRFAPGRETVRYVNAILKRYALYKQYVSHELTLGHDASQL